MASCVMCQGAMHFCMSGVAGTIQAFFWHAAREVQIQLTIICALHAEIGIEQWLGRPESFPLRILVPDTYLHAQVCLNLVLYNSCLFSRQLMRPREGRGQRLIATVSLLWIGFGVAGTLFFATLFTCLEVYAHAKWPSSVPSRRQEAQQRPCKPEARRIKERVEECSRKASQGILLCLECVIEPSVRAPS